MLSYAALEKQSLTATLAIAFLVSTSGCHVLHIPSYRFDSSTQAYDSTNAYDAELLGGVAVDTSDGQCSDPEFCPPGILPPMPNWLARWKKQEELPKPPAYPRFHPLPTRPMFSPAKSPSAGNSFENGLVLDPSAVPDYGALPPASQWQNPNWQQSGPFDAATLNPSEPLPFAD